MFPLLILLMRAKVKTCQQIYTPCGLEYVGRVWDDWWQIFELRSSVIQVIFQRGHPLFIHLWLRPIYYNTYASFHINHLPSSSSSHQTNIYFQIIVPGTIKTCFKSFKYQIDVGLGLQMGRRVRLSVLMVAKAGETRNNASLLEKG